MNIIPLSRPDITEREIKAVTGVLNSGILSIGPYVEEFEKKVASFVGIKHAVAVNSGTGGLHLIVRALGIGEGDEVITTPFSFIASTNCILYERAVPVFADIDYETLEMDISSIEAKITKRTKAILAVDVFGHPCDMGGLKALAEKYNLKIIEDSCESLGSEYMGRKTGALADGAVFAFYPNKQITTSEGGIIATNDDAAADMCRSLRNQGRAPTGLWLRHDYLGYSYRMNELNAALGSVQMDRINDIIRRRAKVAKMYNERLKGVEGIILPYVSKNTSLMSWFVYVIRLEEHICRDEVMEYLIGRGISCKPYFTPIHTQPYMVKMFGYEEEDFPNTAKAGRSCLALPFYNSLGEDEIDYIAKTLKEKMG